MGLRLKDFARGLPAWVWTEFEPHLPAYERCGNGRPPYSNRQCPHALFYVLASGRERPNS
jgi:hypothetical protein